MAMKPCGCVRGQINCPQAEAIWQRSQNAYKEAKSTGDWSAYEHARQLYEQHFTLYNKPYTPMSKGMHVMTKTDVATNRGIIIRKHLYGKVASWRVEGEYGCRIITAFVDFPGYGVHEVPANRLTMARRQ